MSAFDLQRFVEAQQGSYEAALGEIRAGRKLTHWSWFIFPQIAGLGSSEMSRRYAITDLAEARAYLAHPLLGPRLVDCVRAMNAHVGRSAAQILGDVDALKFRSCLTLFMLAAPEERCFAEALGRFFSGVPDSLTLAALR